MSTCERKNLENVSENDDINSIILKQVIRTEKPKQYKRTGYISEENKRKSYDFPLNDTPREYKRKNTNNYQNKDIPPDHSLIEKTKGTSPQRFLENKHLNNTMNSSIITPSSQKEAEEGHHNQNMKSNKFPRSEFIVHNEETNLEISNKDSLKNSRPIENKYNNLVIIGNVIYPIIYDGNLTLEIQFTSSLLQSDLREAKNKEDVSKILSQIESYNYIHNLYMNCTNIIFFATMNSSHVLNESLQILKEELWDIIHPSQVKQGLDLKNFLRVDFNTEFIFFDKDNFSLAMYLEDFNINSNFNELLDVGKKLIEYEIFFYSSLSTEELIKNISINNYYQIISALKNTKMDLIFPELKYIYEIQEFKNVNLLKKGYVLYVHYICAVLKHLSDIVIKNQSKNRKNKECSIKSNKITIITKKKITFYSRKLIADLLFGLNHDSEKIETYRILNTISYYSANITKKNKYLHKNFFVIMMRFLYRFLFDSECKVNKETNQDLIIGMICDLHNRPADLILSRRISEIFLKNFCQNFFLEKCSIGLMELEFKIQGIAIIKTITTISSESKRIIEKLNNLKEPQTHKSILLETLIEFEFIMSYTDRKLLPTDFNLLEFHAGKSYKTVLDTTMHQFKEHYAV
ncbi:hypothetical protein CWI37_0873p0010 [Hamiltosporidium tvaerminnensis]|uniref:Uncharacterized protein n=3 Tax=Hamiltosporidium TaxID=1176354 RepID=A0A4Q9L0L6_9MICR|nr:hypothetical protein CWI37_0873p0010 [Hamiltosporidium tvaerminnensis]